MGAKGARNFKTWQTAITFRLLRYLKSNCTAPGKRAIVPVRSADGSTLFKDRHEILAIILRVSLTTPTLLTYIYWIICQTCHQPSTWDTPPLYSELRQAIAWLEEQQMRWTRRNPLQRFFKHGGYILTRRLHLLIQHLWEYGTLPQDWKDANIVVIYKQKGDRAVCGNSRGISLLSIAGKVLAKIMLSRLVEHISEALLPETQCGFRKSRSTTDMVFVLRQLMEKSREQNKDLYVAFIDLSKAFDTINRELLWKNLSKLGVPPKFLSILRQMHDGMQARVLTGELQSESFEVNVGVKQGCVLAPVLFNIFLSALPASSIVLWGMKMVSMWNTDSTVASSTFVDSRPAQRQRPAKSVSFSMLMTVPS